MNILRERTAEWHTAFNPFRDEFDIFCPCLEITVFAALLHCTYAAHAAIGFVCTSLKQDCLTRGFIGPGKERADHDCISAGSDRFR